MTPDELLHGDLQIGRFLVQPALLRIVAGDATHRVEPKSMAVLMTLASRPQQVVARQEFFDSVWPREAVTDDVLTRAIAELRKRFEDSADRPRVIETIRGRGYRLIAEVRPIEVAPEVESTAVPEVAGEPMASPRRSGRSKLSLAMSIAAVGLLAVLLAWSLWTRRADEAVEAADSQPLRIYPLTGTTAKDRDPDVSPDGTAIVYSEIQSDPARAHLFLKVSDAARPLQLTSGPFVDRMPTFSPDGTRLSFVRKDGHECGIFQIAATGGPVRRLADCPAGGSIRMAWSPDGRWLARSNAFDERTIGLALLDTESLELRPLTRPPVDSVDREPTFSPDGEWLAFNRSQYGSVGDLYAIRIRDLEERRLTHDFRDISGQAWTNDSRRVLFASDRAGIHSLWVADLGGGEPRWLTGSGTKIKHPAHARRAGVAAYEEWQYEINLWRADLVTGAEPEALLRSTAWDLHPSFSPDGAHLSFTSTRSGSHELWLANADGTEPMRLTDLASGYVGQAAWSPDSRSLVFAAHSDGQTDLYHWTLGDVAPVRWTFDEAREQAPSWSADGRHLYFGADKGQGFEIWRLRVGDGAAPVAVVRGSAATESPDGRQLVFARLDDEMLWRQPIHASTVRGGGSPAVRTEIPIGFGRRHTWQTADDGLLLLGHLPSHQSLLHRYPWPNGDLSHASGDNGGPASATVVPDVAHRTFTISPDRRYLVYARTDRADCDILVARNLRIGGE